MAKNNITEVISLHLLSEQAVSVKRVKKAVIDGKEYDIETTRKAYSNSPIGRQMLIDEVPEEWVNVVFEVWGDEPVVLDPEQPEL